MKTIELDKIRQKDIIENNEYLYRQKDNNFTNRLNSAIDFALEKLDG